MALGWVILFEGHDFSEEMHQAWGGRPQVGLDLHSLMPLEIRKILGKKLIEITKRGYVPGSLERHGWGNLCGRSLGGQG